MPALSADARLRIESLIGKRVTSRLNLDVLERSLVARGVGADLEKALTRLGFPSGRATVERRDAAARRDATKQALQAEVGGWSEPWAPSWVDGLARTGQLAEIDVIPASGVAAAVRLVVAAVGSASGGVARNDLAATLFGSSHALDDDTLLERWARRALVLAFDLDSTVDGRACWAAVGVDTDLVSAPVLVWNLELDGHTALGTICDSATVALVPVHLTLMALRRHQVVRSATSPVLVVENPRLVEAAAQRTSSCAVIATNGNPSTAVTTLIDSLVTQGCEVRVHADFDAAGIGICRRMIERGCTPWQMDAAHYDAAVDIARSTSGRAPIDVRGCGPTPWDPPLEARFDAERIVVHEELLIDQLLGEPETEPTEPAAPFS